jgi:hypothetical protein
MLRSGVLAGICLSLLGVAYSIYRYPRILWPPEAPVFIGVFLVGVLCYGYAAIRWTQATTCDEFMVLRYGARWGVVIGLAWTVEVIGGNLIIPHALGAKIGGLAAIVAAILPVAAGASGAARTGRIETGARIGFWSGIVSGLITFLALAIVGNIVVSFPWFPGVETPHGVDRALTADELATFNIGDYLAGGISHLVLIGAPFCSLAGTLGGLLGRPPHSAPVETMPHDHKQ